MINKKIDTIDFVDIAMENSIKFSNECLEIMESMIQSEFLYIESCLEVGQIVMEAESEQTTQKVVKKQNGVMALITALKNLINRFIDKATEISEGISGKISYITGKYSDESFWKKINEVECLPYWQNSRTKIINDCENFVDILVSKFQSDPQKYSNTEELQNLIKQRTGFVKYDFKNALEAYFASGKKDQELKSAKFSYTVLHKNGEEIVSSCSQYGKTSKAFSKITSKVESKLNNFKTVQESVIYGDVLESTILGNLPREYDVVLEAEDKQLQDGKIDDSPKNDNNDNNKPDLNTGIKIDKNNDSNNSSKNTTSQSSVKGLPELNTCIQTIIGAAMNVLQKKFLNSRAIINALTPDDLKQK